MVDGGTSFVAQTRVGAWAPGLHDALALAREPPSRGDGRSHRADRTVRLDFEHPHAAPLGRDCRAGVVRAVWGDRRQLVSLHFEDRAVLDFDVETGRVKVEAKAPELWSSGLARWVEAWLCALAPLVGLPACTVDTTGQAGWRVARLEFCCDFAGLSFHVEDFGGFTGRAASLAFDKVRACSRPGRALETLSVGTRRSGAMLTVHDKGAQQLSVGGVALADSIYAPAWRNGGWQVGENVWRVELRLLDRRHLRLEVLADDDGEPTGSTIDLTNPTAILSRDTLAIVWRSETARVRLVHGSATRKRRAATDPRWLVVQAAPGDGPSVTLRQSREVDEATLAQRRRRESAKLLRDATSLASVLRRATASRADLIGSAALLFEEAFNYAPGFDLEAQVRAMAARDAFALGAARADAPAGDGG
jgi:hypothetical protein